MDNARLLSFWCVIADKMDKAAEMMNHLSLRERISGPENANSAAVIQKAEQLWAEAKAIYCHEPLIGTHVHFDAEGHNFAPYRDIIEKVLHTETDDAVHSILDQSNNDPETNGK